MELNRAVAENIKRIRKSKKMSMEQTAALAGVSRSMLGQIERGEANPSVAIIEKLATALKVPATTLLENDGFDALFLSPELDHKPQRIDGGRVSLRVNFPYDATTRLESFFLDLYVGASYAPPVSPPGCVCHAVVLSGSVSVHTGEQDYTLTERDGIRFCSDQPYRFNTISTATVRLLLVYQYLK